MSNSQSAINVSHVVDLPCRYPGESLTLYTRVDVLQPVPGFVLRIALPEGLALGDYSASANHGDDVPDLLMWEGKRYMAWRLAREAHAGERFEYELHATIAHTDQDLALESRAVVMLLDVRGQQDPAGFAEDMAGITVFAQGRYLKHLPALYTDQDDFMGRFLMLFESFWSPIERQIRHIHYYFDPMMAPPELLPWLATWVDLALNDQWPEDRRRRLIGKAVQLYRKRGTPGGLQEYLEIFTGVTPQITEYRANNFVLGAGARLGPSIALGTRNKSYAFDVRLHLPPIAVSDEHERMRQESERRHVIESIIETQKPAHATYTLDIIEVSG